MQQTLSGGVSLITERSASGQDLGIFEIEPDVKSIACVWLLPLATGCASTTFSGYSAGTVKFSPVNYQYTAQPLVENARGDYRVDAPPDLGGGSTIAAFEAQGLRSGPSGYVFEVEAAGISHKASSFGLGGSYQPALLSTMPIAITVRDANGRALLTRDVKHESALGVSGAKTFKTREAAMAAVSPALHAPADRKVRESAAQTVRKNLQLIARTMLEPREIRVTLPAVRSAGDLNLEGPYTQLSEARSQAEVIAARDAYRRLGLNHARTDGSPDVVANYGVMCGTASAQILEGDLGGAWDNVRLAHAAFPEGREHRQIAQVLLQQQREAGVEVASPDEVQEMMNADLARLKKLFGAK